jgi:hypothetical protein
MKVYTSGIDGIRVGIEAINVSDRYVEGVRWFPLGERHMLMTLGSVYGCMVYLWNLGDVEVNIFCVSGINRSVFIKDCWEWLNGGDWSELMRVNCGIMGISEEVFGKFLLGSKLYKEEGALDYLCLNMIHEAGRL